MTHDTERLAGLSRTLPRRVEADDLTGLIGRRLILRNRLRNRMSPSLAYGRHRGPARLDSRHAAVVVAIYEPQRRAGSHGRESLPDRERQHGRERQPDPPGLCLTLTRRPLTLSHHGGQVCLPGGRVEAGESAIDAALREYREELGVELQGVRVLGYLTPIYVYASDNWVETVVISADTPVSAWDPDPVEVDEVIEMPLQVLDTVFDTAADVGPQGSGGLVAGGSAADRVSPWGRLETRCCERVGRQAHDGREWVYRFQYPVIRFTDWRGQQREVWGATAMLLAEFAAAWRDAARQGGPVGETQRGTEKEIGGL